MKACLVPVVRSVSTLVKLGLWGDIWRLRTWHARLTLDLQGDSGVGDGSKDKGARMH
jgi:hypothetical protein